MIIDSLTHITPDGKWFSTSYDSSLENLLRGMDKCGVERAVVVALDGYIKNEFILRTCEEHSSRLIPGASINPASFNGPSEAALQAKKLLSSGKYTVLKLHPRLHKYDIFDSRFLCILEEVEKADMKVHVWLDTLLYYRDARLAKPPVGSIHDLVARFPSIKFVLLHGCGSEVLRLADAIRDCENTLLDISYTLSRYKGSSVDLDLAFLFKNFDQRIVFGSDFPEVSVQQAITDFDALTKKLSSHKRNAILHKNLSELLEL
jgi:predicted TIM-barrel fold metal-dependent hydrolase